MQTQIQRIAGIKLALEGQRVLVHFEDLAVLLIIPPHPLAIRTGVRVGHRIEETILVLKETDIRIAQAAALREAEIEPAVLLIEGVLQVEEHLLLVPVHHPAQLDLLVVQIDLVELRVREACK